MADLTDLETFVTAVRAGSFAAAARRLNLSPAMVGRRIQALEERHGVRLIERTTRSQRLTEMGEAFLVRATALLEAAEDLDELTRGETSSLSGRIRLTAPTTVGITRLPAILSRFVQAHPDVVVEMSLSDRRVDLVAEGFDLAVRIGHLRASTLVARRVGSYEFVCCAAPDYLARHGVPTHPEDLGAARCVLNLNLVPRNRWPFQQGSGEPFTVEVRGNVEIDNGEAQRAAAIGGAGIAYIPMDLVEADLAAGRLVRLLSDWTLPNLPIQIVHPSRQLVPRRLRAFIDALAEGFHAR